MSKNKQYNYTTKFEEFPSNFVAERSQFLPRLKAGTSLLQRVTKNLPFKKVNYRVKTACGDYPQGSIIPAYLFIDSDDAKGILYLPPNRSRGECGCLILCKEKYVGEYVEINEDSYMNCPNVRKLKKEISKLKM